MRGDNIDQVGVFSYISPERASLTIIPCGRSARWSTGR